MSTGPNGKTVSRFISAMGSHRASTGGRKFHNPVSVERLLGPFRSIADKALPWRIGKTLNPGPGVAVSGRIV